MKKEKIGIMACTLGTIIAVMLVLTMAVSFTACDSGGGGNSDPCKNGHEFTVFVSTTATCIAAGQDTFECNRCTETEEQARDALDHLWEEDSAPTLEPTCTEDGEGAFHCTRCEETDDHHVIDALGHIAECFTGSCRTDCKIYEIGEEGPGGGFIYYVADGQSGRSLGFIVQMVNSDDNYTVYYLEAAPSNVNTRWCACATSEGCRVSGVSGMENVISDDTTLAGYIAHGAIGTGRKNTSLILAAHSTAAAATNAAKACDVTIGGKSDWFLPSLEELKLLYINTTHVGNMGTDTYWSSSPMGNDHAWNLNFDYGSQDTFVNKLYQFYVRAIRAF